MPFGLRCPNITQLPYVPWTYTCSTPYSPGQVVCAKCGKLLPQSQ